MGAAMTSWLEGPALKALSCGKPACLVVLLAAPADDVQTMLDLALGWAPAMPKADFVTVPLPSASIGDGAEAERAAGLDLFLDEMLSRRRLPDSHLALVGFSEGATLALRVGLRRQSPIAALVAFSASAFDAEAPSGASPPILLVHGDADPVSPYPAMLDFKAALKARGAPVWSCKRPGLGHRLDDDGVAAAGEFLSRHVVHKAPASQDHDHEHT
jgi:phospholipase/carboxylesterase